MQAKEHWEHVYKTKSTGSVSWYQAHAVHSLQLIKQTGLELSAPIIDVGGGASTLVLDLLVDGYSNLTVLDLSSAAIAAAKNHIGSERSKQVEWLEANILEQVGGGTGPDAAPPSRVIVMRKKGKADSDDEEC